MIKFFRKIRQRLLAENKFSRYLLYAVGEIFLVVIGILIALQINNWNEGLKERATEQSILKQLHSEYQSNLAQLDEKIFMRNEALEASYFLLEQIDHPANIEENAIYDAFWKLVRDPTFDPIVNDIVGSSNLRLIRNDSLVRLLSNWSSEVYQVQELELQYQKFRSEILAPAYNRLGVSRNVNDAVWKDGYSPPEALDKKNSVKRTIDQSPRPMDLREVLKDVELEGMIAQAITYHQVTNIQSGTLRDRILEMLELMEGEID